ncbi:protein MIGRI [Paludibacterium yongneupense]|uniref:protein MIGRI n=1 Tax=Paludibacterium yongneupense TaxID=400061 RepID=UPI000402191F|nr:hypothetical protein [Paludibacterium yongneupense]
MIGRLFKLVLVAGVALLVTRWLLNRNQRARLHELFSTLAFALVLSAIIMLVLYGFGLHPW